MYKRLKLFFDKNETFYEKQYGFQAKHSTQHAIIDIVNNIQNNMDKKMFSCGIFIDLKKAFDTADHTILVHKLQLYSIRGVINNWFKSYLTERMQTTQIEENISSKEIIRFGVPQAQSLGLYFS
jgi:retron-type reverse transcriptase